MALPKKLKHMNLFYNGHSYMGVCAAVTVPKLARKMEAYRGGGMSGPVKVDLGHSDDGLQMEYTLGGLMLLELRSFGAVRADGVQLRFAGSYQQDDTGEVTPVEVVARGRIEELDMGEAKPGENTEHQVSVTLTYYKLIINGRVEIEIDLLNMIYIVDGVDLDAAHRAAIGL